MTSAESPQMYGSEWEEKKDGRPSEDQYLIWHSSDTSTHSELNLTSDFAHSQNVAQDVAQDLMMEIN